MYVVHIEVYVHPTHSSYLQSPVREDFLRHPIYPQQQTPPLTRTSHFAPYRRTVPQEKPKAKAAAAKKEESSDDDSDDSDDSSDEEEEAPKKPVKAAAPAKKAAAAAAKKAESSSDDDSSDDDDDSSDDEEEVKVRGCYTYIVVDTRSTYVMHTC